MRAAAAAPTEAELRVLDARARALARRPRDDGQDAAIDVVIFTLAGETCALELRHLRHVLPVRELALLPGARPPLVALIGWRGELVGVIDLERMLGGAGAGRTDHRHLLLIGESGAHAMLVDDIVEITSIPPSRIDARATGQRAFVRGVTADAVLVLDGEALIRTLNGEAP